MYIYSRYLWVRLITEDQDPRGPEETYLSVATSAPGVAEFYFAFISCKLTNQSTRSANSRCTSDHRRNEIHLLWPSAETNLKLAS